MVGGGDGHDLVERHHDALTGRACSARVAIIRSCSSCVQQPVFAGLVDERGQLVGCVDGADLVGRRDPVSRRTAVWSSR